MHGIKQGSPYLKELCCNHMIFVQEHCLAPFNVSLLDDICPDFLCYTTSAMGEVISNKLLMGIPYGGVAVFVRQK